MFYPVSCSLEVFPVQTLLVAWASVHLVVITYLHRTMLRICKSKLLYLQAVTS